MKIAATICKTEQVGMDEFRDHKITRVFVSSETFDDVMIWAGTYGIKSLGSVSFSTIEEPEQPKNQLKQ